VGSNGFGQLGDGSKEDKVNPVAMDMTGLAWKTITEISTGGSAILILTSDYMVYGLGENSYGELGDGTKKDSAILVAASTLAGKKMCPN
jgi:alpha-tubulin suppressor-like RCC1 family protein